MPLILRTKPDGRIVLAESKKYAGYLFVCLEDSTIFLAQRSKKDDNMPGKFEGFGGNLEFEESVEDGAKRETIEEAGSFPKIKRILKKVISDTPNGGTYTMFIAELTAEEKAKWKVKLSKEHEDSGWFDKLPSAIHPALYKELKELAAA